MPLEKRLMLDASLPAITGQVLWLDADDTATILDAEGDNAGSGASFSGSVATWVDKSGSGYNVTAPVLAQQPSYTTGILNGNNVISFDGTTDNLINSTAVISGDDFTTFVVFNRTTAAARDAVFEIGNGPSRNGFFINDTGSGRIGYYLNGAFYNYSLPYVVGSYSLVSGVQDTNVINMYLNSNTEISTTGAIRLPTTGIYVGDDSTSGDQLQGNIAELIIYDRNLSNDERHDVETYLASKWGLTITNAAPTVSTNTGVILNEGATSTLLNTMLSFSDTDNTDSNLIYTVTNAVDYGVLINTNTTLTLGVGDTFTQNDINNGYITYTHDGTENFSDTLNFTVTDQLAVTVPSAFVFTITPINEAPIIDGWTIVSSENFESGATGWNDNTTTSGGTYLTTHLGRHSLEGGTQGTYKTYSLTGTQDYVTISFDMYEIDSWDGENFIIYINDSPVFTSSFSVASLNSPVDGSSGIVSWTVQETTLLSANYGYGTTYNDQIYHFELIVNTTAASVKLGFGSTLDQAVTDEAWGVDNVKIYEVDDGGTPGPFNVSETASNGTNIGTITASDPDTADTLTYTITGGTGASVFSIHPTTGIITVTNSSLLNYEATTSYTLNVVVTDTGGLTDTAVVTVNVINVVENTAPVITGFGPVSLSESSSSGITIGTATATDAESNTITYSITAGNADNLFSINSSTGVVTLSSIANLNYERNNLYTLTIRAIDNGFLTLSSTTNVTVNITNVNETPSFSAVQQVLFANPTVVYSATTGSFYKYVTTPVNQVTAMAVANISLNGVSGYLASITSAAENAYLASLITTATWIDGTDSAVEGQWRWSGGPDSGQLFWSGTSTGSAQNGYYTNWNVGEPNNSANEDGMQLLPSGKWNDIGTASSLPYIIEWTGNAIIASLVDGPYALAENSALHTSVGFVTASDPDASDTITYSITGGTGASYFSVDSNTGEITLTDAAAANYELATSYTLDMRVQDIAGLFDTVTVTINITDINDVPTAIGMTGTNIMENSAVGTVVAILSSTDEDVADVHTYSLISNPGGKFLIVGNELRVADNIDYEQTQSIPIIIRTNDGNGGIYDRTVTISIGNEGDTFSPSPSTGIPKPQESLQSTSGYHTAFPEWQESLVRASLIGGEEGQISAFYGLGELAQIVRENTTFEIRSFLGSLKTTIIDMFSFTRAYAGEHSIDNLNRDEISSDHYTKLKQALEFVSQIENSDGILPSESSTDLVQHHVEDKEFNPLHRQFVDIMTYHEQRQAHLRKALLEV